MIHLHDCLRVKRADINKGEIEKGGFTAVQAKVFTETGNYPWFRSGDKWAVAVLRPDLYPETVACMEGNSCIAMAATPAEAKRLHVIYGEIGSKLNRHG